jgi:RNA-directed DNA polymerase
MWFPQLYQQNALNAGTPPNVVHASVSTLDIFKNKNPEIPAILTLAHLSELTDVNYLKLRSYVSRSESYYTHFKIRKQSGGSRVIGVPEPELMRVQRWISDHILRVQKVHHCSSAFSPKSSIVRCARTHCHSRWLLKMDVVAFFASISEIQVYRVFRKIGYQPLIAFELARICTYAPSESNRYKEARWVSNKKQHVIEAYKSSRIGYLVQGAPTSPMLSNLVMFDFDEKINKLASDNGLSYTRYSDDITFSSRSKHFKRQYSSHIIQSVSSELRKIGLTPHPKKMRVIPPGARKVVLGLNVNEEFPLLSRKFKDNLKMHLHFAKRRGVREHAVARGFDSVLGLYRHLRGFVDFANQVDPMYATQKRIELEDLNWPPII